MLSTLDTPADSMPAIELETFHLLIAYEDSNCFKQAQKTSDHVIRQFGDDVVVTNSQWKFEVLQSRSLRELAAEDARSADMIIIAAHGERDLGPEFRAWVETWEGNERHRALVAVLLTDPMRFEDGDATRTYLQDTARSNDMDFFCVELEAPAVDEV